MFVNTVTDLVEWGLHGAPLPRGRAWVLRAGAVVAFLLVWSLASGLVVLGNLFNPIFLAGPWRVLGKVAELAATGQLWGHVAATVERVVVGFATGDRKSTRLNSSHTVISYAVFCLKKKKKKRIRSTRL